MSEEEKKFLEIVDLKKAIRKRTDASGSTRGMNFSVAKGSSVCC